MAEQLKAVATGAKQLADYKNMKPKDQVAYLLQNRKAEIVKMLPKNMNAERLLKVAQIAATTTPALLECQIPSLISAIAQCAQMGLEPNTALGHAYLIPFSKNKKNADGKWESSKTVQVVIGYKGFIDLARRSGQIINIAAHEVYSKDDFELCYGLDEKLNHKPALTNRGELIGYYAVAKLVGGGFAFEFMSLEQVEEIRDREGSNAWKKAYNGKPREKASSPWWDHPIEMGRKTVIRRLAKYLPLSIEFQTAVALDDLAEAGKGQNLEGIDGDYTIIPDGGGEADTETGEIYGNPDYQKDQQVIEQKQAVNLEFPQQPPVDVYEELNKASAQQTNTPRRERGNIGGIE